MTLIALNSPEFLCHPHLDYKIRESYSLEMWKVKCGVLGGQPQMLPYGVVLQEERVIHTDARLNVSNLHCLLSCQLPSGMSVSLFQPPATSFLLPDILHIFQSQILKVTSFEKP